MIRDHSPGPVSSQAGTTDRRGGVNDKRTEPEDDRDILTIGLARDELLVALDPQLTKKQKNLRIHRMRARRRRIGQ